MNARSDHPARCLKCGYDLSASFDHDHPVRPECGMDYTSVRLPEPGDLELMSPIERAAATMPAAYFCLVLALPALATFTLTSYARNMAPHVALLTMIVPLALVALGMPLIAARVQARRRGAGVKEIWSRPPFLPIMLYAIAQMLVCTGALW